MKNVKLLSAFAAGVAITLALAGGLPAIHGFNLQNSSFDDGIAGTLALIALILVAAFFTARLASQPAQDTGAPHDKTGQFFQFLKNLKASRTDWWFGGICGGLGEKTRVPAWVWRLGFTVASFYYVAGPVTYVLFWIFLPVDQGVASESGQSASARRHGSFLEFLRSLKRSSNDRWFGGVCGGLAEETSVPVWVWRLGFAVFTVGGLLPYVLLWIFVPLEEAKPHVTA